MKSTLIIEHGETTCAVEPGKFCQYLGVTSFGTKAVCMLHYSTPLFEHTTGEYKGWIARCHECYNTLKGDAK